MIRITPPITISVTQAERLMAYVDDRGIIRPRDLRRLRIPRAVLQRLVDAGRLVRRARGIYTAAGHEVTENTDLAAAAKRVPHSIMCLLSALRFHDLTTQNPTEVWMMIDRQAWRPRVEHPRLRVVRASGKALKEGIHEHLIEGVLVPITNPAKTVADCFKYRRLVGTDVAIEALRECWKQRRATMDEIDRYAKINRMANVMRPYLEAIV